MEEKKVRGYEDAFLLDNKSGSAGRKRTLIPHVENSCRPRKLDGLEEINRYYTNQAHGGLIGNYTLSP